jgi:hypothetical protein
MMTLNHERDGAHKGGGGESSRVSQAWEIKGTTADVDVFLLMRGDDKSGGDRKDRYTASRDDNL